MTSSLKQLNKYQLNNRALLTPITLELLKAGDWRNTPAPLLSCTKCGGKISTFIMRFFNWRAEDFECYVCQGIKNNN
jgi:hypothetical protein